MSMAQSMLWHHGNKYTAESACEHCQGVVRHETWCVTRSQEVLYAYEAAMNAENLTEGDRLILHALGAAWVNNVATDSRMAVEAGSI
jgi:hypothetical protein